MTLTEVVMALEKAEDEAWGVYEEFKSTQNIPYALIQDFYLALLDVGRGRAKLKEIQERLNCAEDQAR